MMILWIVVILLEALLLVGLVLAFRQLCRLENRFEDWRVDAVPALQNYRIEMRDLRHRLEKLDDQSDDLAEAAGWRGRVALWVVDQIIG